MRRLKPLHCFTRKPSNKSMLLRLPRGETLDMFDGVRVTREDVLLWCYNMAGMLPDSPRLARYVEGWNVPDKVAAAKQRGEWPPDFMAARAGFWAAFTTSGRRQ